MFDKAGKESQFIRKVWKAWVKVILKMLSENWIIGTVTQGRKVPG